MKNTYEVHGDVVFIDIKYRGTVFKTKISASKLDKLLEAGGTWGASPLGQNKELYVAITKQENGKKHTIYLHRFLLDVPKGMVVDHKNHDPLDNTDGNIVLCTVSENLQNMTRAKKNSKSGVLGVCYERYTGKWKAAIMVNRKSINLGRYADIDDAIKARKEGEVKYFPYIASIS